MAKLVSAVVPKEDLVEAVHTAVVLRVALLGTLERLLTQSFQECKDVNSDLDEEEAVRLFRLKAKELRRALKKCRVDISSDEQEVTAPEDAA